MYKELCKKMTAAALFLVVIAITRAQGVKEPTSLPATWSKAYKPFRIAGNLYYVGTYDLACYLITTSKGNILINTGLAASATQIKKNVEALGFRFRDIKILLTTQAHYDHLGAMAAVKKQTGASLMVNEKDASVVRDGGRSDYAFGDTVSSFVPVSIDRLLKDKDTIALGAMKLVMLHHPGHTKGSCSYLFTVKDSQRSYKVLVANMPTIVTDSSFAHLASYPEIASDYDHTLKEMKKLSFDIWLASHAGQFSLHEKHKPGDPYNPRAFFDQKGYQASLEELEKDYAEKIKN
jgi:metallo-beta-lactamase class B